MVRPPGAASVGIGWRRLSIDRNGRKPPPHVTQIANPLISLVSAPGLEPGTC